MLAQELPVNISFTAGGFLFSSSYDKTINVWSLQVYLLLFFLYAFFISWLAFLK